ncbi:hypothetical protein TDB9533_02798 [Thalassocella blandensis]|nr:hypothetical protein TDB9533_02798 [Thalassocella blandensis]
MRTLARRVWGTIFTLVIAIAVVVQLGRQAFPMIKDYREEIVAYIEGKIGMQVEVGEVHSEWSGLRPSIGMKDLKVISEEGIAIFHVENASAQLSILDSIFKWRLAWRQIQFDGFETSLVQAEDGSWSIHGAPKFTPNKNDENATPIIDDPYDIFLFGRRINITDAQFYVQFETGKMVDILVPKISLENDKNFHRLVAELDVEEGEEAFKLIVEGQGDPRDDKFTSNGYLALENFSTTKVIQALGGKIAGKNIELNKDEENKLNVALWFRGTPSNGMTFRGSLEALGFPLEMSREKFNLPEGVSANVVGKFHRNLGWDIGVRDLQVNWSEQSSPKLDLQILAQKDKNLTIKTPELNLSDWSELLLHFGLGNERADDMVQELALQGTLKDIQFELTNKESGYFLAKMRLEHGKSNAVMGVPAFDNVGGEIEFNLNSGKANIAIDDGFSVFLPKVYFEPLRFDQASGQIAWEINLEKRITYITSSLLKVANSDEEGHGYLYLSLPFKKEEGEQEMTLSLGIKETLAANHKRYVPKTVPKHLYNWLDSSIKQGTVKNVRFLYSGSVEKDPYPKPSIQLYAEVYDGNLVFDPNWPELKGVSGVLRLENDNLDVRIDKASLLGNSVHDATISVVQSKQSDARLLSIKGGVESDVESAMALLKSSPIREYIGSTFDTWDVAGDVSAKVELLIPLSSEEDSVSHKIDVRFANADIHIPDIDLDINKISGLMHYTTDKGVYAEKIRGRVWGEKINATIESPRNSSGGFNTVIGFKGPVEIAKLRTWTKRPELMFAEGKSPVQGKLSIIHDENKQMSLRLDVASRLKGVEVDLPQPFAKGKDTELPFSAQIEFLQDSEQYEFLYGDELRVLLLSDEYFSISSIIELGEFDSRKASDMLAATGKFDIRGRISKFDLDQWNAVLENYLSFSAEMLGESEEFEPTPATLDVAIDQFFLGSFAIDQLHVKGERKWPYWDLNIDSTLMAGLVRVPEEDAPIEMMLKYLRIESDEEPEQSLPVSEASEEAEKESVLADLDLDRAVALQFSADEFYLGDENYGSWKFNVEPIEKGIAINDIQATVKGMRIGDNNAGASFLWLKDGGKQSSQFVGTIHSNNLADVFKAWGQEVLLESESARIDIDAQWNAAPDQVTLKMVKGLIILDVNKGSFNRGAGSDENAFLRLLALFNFDTILRRLRLDFADLAAQGFSYDKIYGSLNFEDGNIFLTDPMIVESSSSVVQVAGVINVIDEKLDTEMVITLPFASNLAVATAVVAGLPTAVGIYLMGKLFKSQVDKASSINMQVVGDWEDPKIKISKIFDIDAAARKGRELEQKAKNKVSPEFHNDPILENELNERLHPVQE